MDFNSREIQVFVSCPSDVKEEKAIIKEVCEIVNKDLLSVGYKVHLTFRDFSEIIGFTGKRPQQIINEQISNYDVYIGILHMRFGTPTGATNPHTGKEFESGTEEEFFLATEKRNASEHREIYFFLKDPVPLNDIPSVDQFKKVLEFKKQLIKNDWVNSFSPSDNFERIARSLLTRICLKISIDESISEKQDQLNEFENSVNQTFDKGVYSSAFVPKFPEITYYISRNISPLKRDDPETNFWFLENEKLLLNDVILKNKRIVLLGNAGSGKSIELQQTATHFLKTNTPFIPVYKRFNAYVNESIEDFIPKNWKHITPELLLILLDGFDEIQPQFVSTAVRRIIEFSDNNPDLRIVISSRTNFYELPAGTFSGTLPGFEVYTLHDISAGEIKNYVENQFDLSGEKFIQDAYDASYLDLVQKPFFLNILLKHYLKRASFDLGRAAIIEEFIFSMIDLDHEHYKTKNDEQLSKQEIINLLEKLAFVMELCGKNYLTNDELTNVLTTSEIGQIRQFSGLNLDGRKDQWMFSHNNIQEYLASRLLARQKFENLIKTIAFAPEYIKLKPTWVNTASFFVSIGEKNIVSSLIDWFVENEPESLVKFEPDRVRKELRIAIFKKIYNSYKEKNIWISSNKFTYSELGRFASSIEILNFLLDEIQNRNNSEIVRRNALNILDDFDLTEFDINNAEKVKFALIDIIENDNLNNNMIYSLLYSMSRLKLSDKNTLDCIVAKFRNRKNQYIRAGLYKLIGESNYIEYYTDIFLDGLSIDEIENAVDDRESFSLGDESYHLEESLKRIKSPDALKKIIDFFSEPIETRRYSSFRQREIFDDLLKNAFAVAVKSPSLLESIYGLYLSYGRLYDEYHAKMISTFFKQHNKAWFIFNRIWNDETIENFDKDFLINLLFSEALIDDFIENYTKRDFTNKDVVRMHNLLITNIPSDHADFHLVEMFEQKIANISDVKLERPKKIDWNSINKQKTQLSFDLLFDKQNMLEEIRKVFADVEKEEIEYNDLWELRRDEWRKTEDFIIPAAMDLLRDFTTHGRKVSYLDVEAWINESNGFENYQINEVYQQLHGGRAGYIELKDHHKKFITSWSNKAAENSETESSFDQSKKGASTLSVDWRSKILWFFIKSLEVPIPLDKLLDFTLFYDFENRNDASESATIEALEKYVSKEALQARVILNLSTNIAVGLVWVSNAIYAINNNLKASFPFIIRDLKEANKDLHYRSLVLKSYFEKTHNVNVLQELLTQLSIDGLRWPIVRLLLNHESQKDFLVEYLNSVLESDESSDDKLESARYLMQLDQLSGLYYVADLIVIENDQKLLVSGNLQSISHISRIEAIPTLIELLKVSKQLDTQTDRFDNFELVLFNTIYKIGTQSEVNFGIVKQALENFIIENSANLMNLNFIYLDIQRMEDQLYMNRAQDFSIEDAVADYEKLVNK